MNTVCKVKYFCCRMHSKAICHQLLNSNIISWMRPLQTVWSVGSCGRCEAWFVICHLDTVLSLQSPSFKVIGVWTFQYSWTMSLTLCSKFVYQDDGRWRNIVVTTTTMLLLARLWFFIVVIIPSCMFLICVKMSLNRVPTGHEIFWIFFFHFPGLESPWKQVRSFKVLEMSTTMTATTTTRWAAVWTLLYNVRRQAGMCACSSTLCYSHWLDSGSSGCPCWHNLGSMALHRSSICRRRRYTPW